MDKMLKIVYNFDVKRVKLYEKRRIYDFSDVQNIIETCLFEDYKLPRCETRIFWIDADDDEIDITDEKDYLLFQYMLCNAKRKYHLYVAPVEQPIAAETTSQSVVHDLVECDSCSMSPIVGFRYKCIQCPNYDLCQNCEYKHKHPEHMMVRYNTNDCPNVIQTYVTGSTKSRRRSRIACPLGKNGSSDVNEKDAEATTTGGENSEKLFSRDGGKERHNRRKHSQLQQELSDCLDAILSSKSSNDIEGAVNIAAEHAHDAAVKATEIAVKVSENICKSINENNTASASANKSTDASTQSEEKDNDLEKEKNNGNETPVGASSVMVQPMEGLGQFLDPQFIKNGFQILNNFSHMFAKMLDPSESINSELYQSISERNASTSNGAVKKSDVEKSRDINKNQESDGPSTFRKPLNFRDIYKSQESVALSTSSILSNVRTGERSDEEKSINGSLISTSLNNLGSEKNFDEIKSADKNPNTMSDEEEQLSNASSKVEIEDLGSDTENDSDSVAGSFVKLNLPKNTDEQLSPSTLARSAEITPPISSEKSNVLDFHQLSSDLKAHIALEADKQSSSSKTIENIKDTADKPTTSGNGNSPNIPVEKRAVPVYHADQRINKAVYAMMAMGFSNEGARLTQLLENVDGNIDAALDILSASQCSQ